MRYISDVGVVARLLLVNGSDVSRSKPGALEQTFPTGPPGSPPEAINNAAAVIATSSGANHTPMKVAMASTSSTVVIAALKRGTRGR